jgi:hypothetical protein
MTVEKMSDYHLLYELLKEGRGDLDAELEPIDVGEIARVLKARTGKDFGQDVEAWVAWFLDAERLTPQDKTNLGRIKKLVDMERKFVPRIDKNRKE